MNQCSPPWSGSTTSSWCRPPTPCWSRRAPRPSMSRFWSKNSSCTIIAPAVEHRRIYRPWGYYQDVDIAARYRVKRIVVKPGSTLSLQKHFHRSEHWVVVKGTAEVTIGNDVRNVHENESSYIPIGSIHRLANPGKIPLELIEVQVGSYLGEDDIVRLDDVYGRGSGSRNIGQQKNR